MTGLFAVDWSRISSEGNQTWNRRRGSFRSRRRSRSPPAEARARARPRRPATPPSRPFSTCPPPTWIADDLTVTVTAAQPANVSLTFHGNGSAVVSGDFAGDEYTASTLAGAAGQQASV